MQGKNKETNISKRKYREKADRVQVDHRTLRGVLEARSGGGAEKSLAVEGETNLVNYNKLIYYL